MTDILAGGRTLPGHDKPILWDDEHAFDVFGHMADDSRRFARDVLAAAGRGVVYVDRLSQDPMRVAELPPYASVRRPTRFDPAVRKAALVELARQRYIAQFPGLGGWTEEVATGA